MKKAALVAEKAPAAIGPYSQGLACGDLIFVSGQIPLSADGVLVAGGAAEQTEQCLRNVREVLAAAGLTMKDVVKATVFMTDLGQFSAMNEAYARHFAPPFPARAAVQVSALPKGAGVEIEVVAVRP